MTDRELAQQIAVTTSCLNLIPGVVIIHHIERQTVVYMSQRGLDILGITMNELHEMGKAYYPRFFNTEEAAEYVPKILGLLNRNNDKETVSYFQQVRASPTLSWSWYLSGTKIFMRDKEGKPLLTITIALPVDIQHNFTANVERLVKENDFFRKNKHLFASLTKREREVLVYIAKGSSSLEIAEDINIAEDTVKTHRRNIKRKINAQNHYDISYFAQVFGLL